MKRLLIIVTAVIFAVIFTSCKKDRETYTVTFNSNGGSEVESQTVQEGEKAAKPQPAPTREGYFFGGWYTDYPALTNKWDFDTDVVVVGITLYAKWGTVKLLETWTTDYENYYMFEYDEQNRITKIKSRYNSTNTLMYEGDDLIHDGTYEYTKSGNTITQKHSESGKTTTIELNSDGLPVTWDSNYSSPTHISIITHFEYQNGNLSDRSLVETYSNLEWDWDCFWNIYKYDNEKGALYHCKTPKWYLIMYLNDFGVKNNITYYEYWGNVTIYDYEFDDAGFPIKRTCTNDRFMSTGSLEVWEEKFTYIMK